jgi:uncharacterized protein DUF547
MSGSIGRRAVLGGLGLAALAPGAVSAAPRANPWPRWQPSDEGARTSIDHAAWDGFLARHLVPGADGINRVAYRRVLPGDREALSIYIAGLCGLPITAYRRDEQQAYWINLYNALTARVVLEHYPVASILDINLSGGLAGRGPWSKKLVHIEGEEVSLDDIEHRILRPFWRDPRLHYALNCAALGCPNLGPRAFVPASAEAALDEAARRYVNHPRGARIDNGRLYVSSIYVWYKTDFGGNDRGVIEHLRRYAAPPLAPTLAPQATIAGDSYDWSLNDAKLL